MSGLTSHVLDTLHGIPASGVTVALYSIAGKHPQLVHSTTTDTNGRCTLAEQLTTGCYRIEFAIGDYFARTAPEHTSTPRYTDLVGVEFGVADTDRHYHIPLVASPWSYTTYRGGAPAQPPQQQ